MSRTGNTAGPRRGTGEAPLAGIKVLDLTQVVAGPYCTMMLADMGAEVAKLERPGHGDDLRRTVPYRGREGHQDYYNALNRSKKSVALDLKNPLHRDLALRLAAHADVMVENYAPGTVARLGLGWDQMSRLNPRLVYCSVSGFGQTGPYRNRVALDPIIQAVSGSMSVTGEPDGEPMKIGAPVADVIAGMFAAYSIVSALHVVKRDGRGQHIDLSLQDAMLAVLGTRMGEPLQAGVSPQRLGNENPLRVPAGTCRTADGAWLEFMVLGEHNWPPFCRAMGRSTWRDDPRFGTMALRLQHRRQINKLVATRFLEHRAAYWARRLEAERIPYALVNDYRQALDDPQVAHRGLVRKLQHPTSGPIRVVGPPWIMSESGTTVSPPANLGQHTAEVLREWLGMAPGEIEAVTSISDGTADERR
jgi:crotonobetainyl-CoA:carnitine CoA-transferase CaiB-like acyl-CoA transferase